MERYTPFFENNKFKSYEIYLFNLKEGNNPAIKFCKYYEAVFRPEEYIKTLVKDLEEVIPQLSDKYTIDNIKIILNNLFSKHNITFVISPIIKNNGDQSGINEMKCGERTKQIIVVLNYKIKEILFSPIYIDKFYEDFKLLIGHELIHRAQFLARKKERLLKQINDFSEMDYLKNKQEIMSYAWQTVEELKYQGAKDSDIISFINKPDTERYDGNVYSLAYYPLFKNTDEQVLNRFKKYVAEYLSGDKNKNIIKVEK